MGTAAWGSTRRRAALCSECHGPRIKGRVPPTNGPALPPLDKRGFHFFFSAMPAGREGFVPDRFASERAGVEGLKSDGLGSAPATMPTFGETLSRAGRQAITTLIHAMNAGGRRSHRPPPAG
jgi:mono/diheme cytochrome c family protein